MCRCKCGKQVSVNRSSLLSGRTKSCGCLQDEIRRKTHFKHGLSRTPIDATWQKILRRCYNANCKEYVNYGGRGIRVCEFIRSSPANLLALIGEKPSGHYSVGRIENNGHYSCGVCADCLKCCLPFNIRWETDKQQARNKRNNHLITIGQETKCLAEWAEVTGINRATILTRLKNGQHPLNPPKGSKYQNAITNCR